MMILNFVFAAISAMAAPIPLTSTSALISRNEGLYRSPLGFSIHASETGWKQLPPPSKNDYIVTMYENHDASKPSALTVRVDELKKPVSLDEYSKNGFVIIRVSDSTSITAKKVRVGTNIGYMLDLLSRENKKTTSSAVVRERKESRYAYLPR